MARVTDPIALFGVEAYGRKGGRLPMTIVGAKHPVPVRYTVPMPSAQVKSAVMLAGLNAPGETVIIEKEATRDHTERMLVGFGAEVNVETSAEGRVITLQGYPELKPQTISVPRDPSSAAFPVCAALITEGSDILVPNIGLNPTRAGLYTTLREMGADLVFENERIEGEDWWIIHGKGMGNVPGGGLAETFLDHRIAMSFLILGMGSEKPVRIDDGGPIVTSFPNFEPLMTALGAKLTRDNH
jgi:5-enolpyruvylshikimate-3-phosphate synthase